MPTTERTKAFVGKCKRWIRTGTFGENVVNGFERTSNDITRRKERSPSPAPHRFQVGPFLVKAESFSKQNRVGGTITNISEFSIRVDERNTKRPRPFRSFDLSIVEASIGI